MDLKALREEHQLLPETLSLIAQVEEQTGKAIDFRISPNLATAGSTKMARTSMPQHIVIIKQDKVKQINYLIAHECGHMLRMAQVAATERTVPGQTEANIAAAARTLSSELGYLPPQLHAQALQLYVTGLVSQVTNIPVDIRIEIWLFQEYPGLRADQMLGIAEEAKLTAQAVSSKVERMTPRTVFRASNAMNAVYYHHVDPCLNTRFGRPFRNNPLLMPLANSLEKHFPELDGGYKGDIATINAWAEVLGISNWLSWTDFEDIPPDYNKT